MTDYILSIDPGTKNISYCLISVKTREIVKWEVFSIEYSTYEGRCKKFGKRIRSIKTNCNN